MLQLQKIKNTFTIQSQSIYEIIKMSYFMKWKVRHTCCAKVVFVRRCFVVITQKIVKILPRFFPSKIDNNHNNKN